MRRVRVIVLAGTILSLFGVALAWWLHSLALMTASLIAFCGWALWADRKARRRGDDRPGSPAVEIDERGVRRSVAGQQEEVSWGALTRVEILTTSEGPFVEDVYWLLTTVEGSGCAIPNEAATALVERLQRLPRFDHGAMIAAMGSTSENAFLLWEGSAGEGLVAALTPPAAPTRGG